jgi:sugar lactone lactonase YvrE
MTRRFYVFVIAGILLMTVTHIGAEEPNKKHNKTVSLHIPRKLSPEHIRAKDAALRRGPEGNYLYLLDRFRGVVVKKADQNGFSQFTHFSWNADSIAVDSRGQVYLADADKHRVTVLSAFGTETKSLTIPYPRSVAVLSDGNLVVGSTFGNKLIHIYSPDGKRLRSFGDLKTFDADNRAQNHYLNRGKAVVDSEDNIYYVPQTALIPFIQKFSKDGTMLREFSVEGEAIDIQVDFGRRVAGNLSAQDVGGATIINSAFVDETDHLWICLNGSSKTGVVYEYDSEGRKLNEYAFHQETGALSAVETVCVAASDMYIFTMSEALIYDLKKASIR